MGTNIVLIDGESLLLVSLINQPLAPGCRYEPPSLFIFLHLFFTNLTSLFFVILTQSRCSSQEPAVFPRANSLLIYNILQKGKTCKRSASACLAFILQIKPHKHTFPDLPFRYSFHNSLHNLVARCPCSRDEFKTWKKNVAIFYWRVTEKHLTQTLLLILILLVKYRCEIQHIQHTLPYVGFIFA